MRPEIVASPEENLIARGFQNASVSQAPPTVENSVLQYIERAIEDGDRLKLGCQGYPESEPAMRRALIVAVQYELHHYVTPLLSTLQDVVHVHETLVKHGYDRNNIRILAEGFDSSNGYTAEPIRDNIIQSLEWLASNARPGDYRYFHFSGHGTSIEAGRGKGKAAVEIPESSQVKTGDYELDNRLNKSMRYTQIPQINITNRQIKYYNQAIITGYKSITRRDKAAGKSDEEHNRMRDDELNKHFAQLPRGCTLTCTLDCCHSGRLIDNNVKVAGAGFRWSPKHNKGNIQATEYRGVVELTSVAENRLFRESQITSGTRSTVSTPTDDGSAKSPVVQNTVAPIEPLVIRGASQPLAVQIPQDWKEPEPGSPVANRRKSYISPLLSGEVMWTEALPLSESSRDAIKANVLTWSSCHQRQKAVDYGANKGGAFTQAFAKVAKGLKGHETVGEVHKRINHDIKTSLDSRKSDPFMQYIQVWTSLGDEGEDAARGKIDKPFVI